MGVTVLTILLFIGYTVWIIFDLHQRRKHPEKVVRRTMTAKNDKLDLTDQLIELEDDK